MSIDVVALPNIKPCSLYKFSEGYIINEALVYVTKFEDVLDIVRELTNSRKSVEVVWLGLKS